MKNMKIDRSSERGAVAVKVLLVFLVLGIAAHAGINYIPVAYNGASFRQEMDTAVVKALAGTGRIKPLDVVTASINRASKSHNLPEDTFVEITPINGSIVEAHVSYTEKVNILPFGLYKYDYKFDYIARPQGYLLEE